MILARKRSPTDTLVPRTKRPSSRISSSVASSCRIGRPISRIKQKLSYWHAFKGHNTREIRVILYAKDDPFCATASADELSIEDVLAVEDDVIPLDGADVFQLEEIDSIGD